ncbi:MAG: succinate dehydrogenase, hydrophobic membrane anchor protein [Pseudomonadota bacterium]
MRSPVDQKGHSLRPGHRTALKSIRYLGSAKDGTDHFIKQRMTALANFFLVIVLAFVAISVSGRSYDSAIGLLGQPLVAVPLALALISVSVHLKLGLQVVIEDYVPNEGLRLVLLLLNTFFAFAIGAAGLYAVLQIMFTGAVVDSPAAAVPGG